MTADPLAQRSEFESIVGSRNVLDAAAMAGLDPGFDSDNLSADLLVMPASCGQLAEVVAVCNRDGIQIVPHGGRTGLSGGGSSRAGQVIIALTRMSKIEQLDPMATIAVVEAGATLQSVEAAAREHGLSVGIDLGARGTATIGGMISTNAGGMEAFRNGSMRNRVIGLEAVLADGRVLSDMAKVAKCNEGYDIKQLFCGAEGTLGIITRAVLKLEPAKPDPTTFLIACEDAASAIKLMRAAQGAEHLDLIHAEIMWRDAAHLVARCSGLSHVFAFCDAPVYAIFELICRAPQIGAEEALFEAIEPVAESLLDAVVAKNDRERKDIWRVREDSFVIDAELPGGMWVDVSVPLGELDAYVAGVVRDLAAIDPALRAYAIGHLADGNLHYTITKGEPLGGELSAAITSALYEPLKPMGGSFSAEHGIGTEKKNYLAKYASPEKLHLMRSIKQMLDPNGIMNPGKVL